MQIIWLLAVLWMPIFLVSGYLQLLSPWVRKRPVARLAMLFALEVMTALVIWLSPLHKLLPKLKLSGFYGFSQTPLLSALLAALLVTSVVIGLAKADKRRPRAAGPVS